ncbi:MAG TPA: SDR family oxidoreductase [Trinickia sp.]|nr:SDR family oxidoreductase [Trinickia sp.]
MTQPLAGKVAVIVGGTGGIGRASAQQLAHAGARVAVVAQSNVERAQAVVHTLPEEGHLALAARITDSAALARLANEVGERLGRADILINTAGFTKAIKHADLDALDDELIDEIFRVNWRGQFAAIRAFRPLLAASGDGLVVNVSSIAGRTGVGSNVAYCAVKAGLDVMAVSLARALAPTIRVLNVAPGVVDTEFVPGRGPDFNEKAAATTPLGRIGTPNDVASAILACATNLRFSTGVTFVVDGGRGLN